MDLSSIISALRKEDETYLQETIQSLHNNTQYFCSIIECLVQFPFFQSIFEMIV